MPKRLLAMNVFDAAIERLKRLCAEGHTVVVMFSGGKDSGVCVELAIIAATETNRLPVYVAMRDEEVMLPGTFEYAERIVAREEVDFHWIIAGQPIVNVFNRKMPYWWVFDDRLKPDEWVRMPPDFAEWIPEQNIAGIVNPKRFKVKKGKNLISVIGLRIEESPNRRLGLHSSGGYLTKVDRYGVRTARPIYDWSTGDVWLATQKHGWDYNHAYDTMSRYGMNRQKMRIGPPTLTVAGAEQLGVAFKAYPKWADKVARRLDGTRIVANFGKAALKPIRRSDETWEGCYQRLCIDEAPEWIAKRAIIVRDKVLAQYGQHSSGPFPEVVSVFSQNTSGLVGSWRNLCNIMYLGDPFVQKATKAGIEYMEPSDFRDDLPDHRKTWGGKPSW